ncbi:MAG: Lacal_2735 family protein [Cyclobacteriaceae bacterium]|nr:Lacal_2735 family protein [Cyclobacteriaceae bacterium]
MFKLFTRDPLKNLQKKRNRLFEEAMLTQRSGNLRLYAEKMVEIDALEKKIDILQSAAGPKAA